MPLSKFDSDIIRQLNVKDESIKEFIEGRRRRLRPLTLYNYIKDLEFIQRNLRKSLLKCDADDIVAFFDFMEKDLGHKRSSIKRRLATLSSFFNYHRRAGNISSNPVEQAEDDLPRWERSQGKPVFLSKEEVFQIINYHRSTFNSDSTSESDQRGIRNHSLLITLIFTGIRVNKASQLDTTHFRDIDTDSPYLEILDAKGGKNRDIPLHGLVVDAYKKWMKAKISLQFQNQYCYINLKSGNPLCDRTIQWIVKNIAKESRIQKDISPHKCRHTFATSLLKSGANIKDIQELLGHASIETSALYLHSDQERKQDVIRGLPAPEE